MEGERGTMTEGTKWLYSAALLGGLTGCQSQNTSNVRVFAASSLTDVMSELAASFETAHPTVNVEISTAGSHLLRMQLENGAEADLFASASSEDISVLVDRGLFKAPTVFAEGSLMIYLAEGNTGVEFSEIDSIESWVVGTPDSPIGRYTEQFLTVLGDGEPRLGQSVRAKFVSHESNVRLIRTKIDLGVAQAGIVYYSDIHDREERRRIPVPLDLQPEISYLMAVHSSARSDYADLFQQFVLTDGQGILNSQRFN